MKIFRYGRKGKKERKNPSAMHIAHNNRQRLVRQPPLVESLNRSRTLLYIDQDAIFCAISLFSVSLQLPFIFCRSFVRSLLLRHQTSIIRPSVRPSIHLVSPVSAHCPYPLSRSAARCAMRFNSFEFDDL